MRSVPSSYWLPISLSLIQRTPSFLATHHQHAVRYAVSLAPVLWPGCSCYGVVCSAHAMDSFNYLIVGSGPSGMAAARRLRHRGTCVVDIGNVPQQRFAHPSLRQALRSGDADALLGPSWEMLANLVTPERVHPKLRAPGMQHVLAGHAFDVHRRDGSLSLAAAASHAEGGMSNAWGAQLLRYTSEDLDEAGDWPLRIDALQPHYADLEQHIGISGVNDEMSDFLGGGDSLLAPAPLVPAAEHLLRRYGAQRKSGLTLGRARLAVLTEPYRGYPAYPFGETEFFSAESPSIYSATRTLQELKRDGSITHLAQSEVLSYSESADGVEVQVMDRRTHQLHKLRASHLLLACGAVQTARLVLLNANASGHCGFIDHTPMLAPFFLPRMFGSRLPERSFPVQLLATFNDQPQRDLVSFYYPGGLLWSDLLGDIPLPMDRAVELLPSLLGGMLVAQVWEISRASRDNRLQLKADGGVRIDYGHRPRYERLPRLMRLLRPLGAHSLARWASMSEPGRGFHYAGCLPMRHDPGPFETHVDGRLWDKRRVRVLDGSVLPSLPAKNHSLTMMANAARIADECTECGY
jgi:choline dehydrogenase-like flavoprotein